MGREGPAENEDAQPRPALTRRRVELGMSRADLGAAIGKDASAVTRYELGQRAPRAATLLKLARSLDWSVDQVQAALDRVEIPPPPGHVVPPWLDHLASLEQGAGWLYAFEAVGVHGLLQTPDYAQAVESVGPVRVSRDELARKVEMRLTRQDVLSREPEPLQLVVILDESVTLRPVGGSAVMAAQLDHLAKQGERPNVDIRVLPFSSGYLPFGSFTLFAPQGSDVPFMGFTEDRNGAHHLNRNGEAETHHEYFKYLMSIALSPEESAALFCAIAKEHRG